MEQFSFQALKKNHKKDFSSFKKIKIAVLGDFATQMYVQAFKGYGYEVGLDFDIFEAEYNQIDYQVYNTSSKLYEFEPEFVIIFNCTNKLVQKFGRLDFNEKADFAQGIVEKAESVYHTILSRLKCKVIIANYPEINDAVFGNFGNKTNLSFIYQVRKINFDLMNLARNLNNFFILDVNSLQSEYGHSFISDHKIYVNTDLFPSIDFLPILAKSSTDIILSMLGRFNKCIILDLDNTIWGGIIGDDGIENIQIGDLGIGKAFSELQLWLKQLKQRGILLAVCSKNDETVAKEPFEKHPEMILRLDDIALFVANWKNKADNIKYIQQVLNIGFDSMVFLDDNPFERGVVRTQYKDVTIPELPEDPADYLNFLCTQNLFETASFTIEDEQRTSQYQEEAKRTTAKLQFSNEQDFLKNLNMVSLVEPINKFNIPRVAQLTQRSNQFNLRTIRYTEEDIQRISVDPDYITLTFSLKDKFGDYGLISVIILKILDEKALFIDTWIMSCRVLKRDMEIFILNCIIIEAIEKGFTSLIGEFLPTTKNNMVKNHFESLGFTAYGDLWKLSVDDYRQKENYINSLINDGKH